MSNEPSQAGPLDPRLFGEGPARDRRFLVKERWREMTNLEPTDPRAIREFLHRQMNQELDGLEICCRTLVDFPDAPWELRMALARQCSDEARHTAAFRRCFELRGGTVGEFPVINFQFRMLARIESLVGRLAVQNRSFEAAGIDAIQEGLRGSQEAGHEDLVELLDAQLADEVQHVRFANEWVRRLLEQGGARIAFEMAKAVQQANEAFHLVVGEAVTSYPVAEQLRREAGFSDAEIRAVAASPLHK